MVDHSRLLQLPRELIHQTLGSCSRSELLALCRVCRVLYGLVTPELYEVVEITYRASNHDHPHQLNLFLRTILQNPERASYVKQFHLNRSWTSRALDYRGTATLAHEIQQLATTALTCIQFPLSAEMVSALGSGTEDNIDAAVAILFLLLPRLKTLELEYLFRPWTRSNHGIHEASTKAFVHSVPSEFRVEALRAFQDSCLDNGCAALSVYQIPSFFDPLWLLYLPEIETIDCRILEYHSVFQWPLSPPFNPTLVALKLQRSSLRPQTLRELLLVTPNLRMLEYHHAINIDSKIALEGHKVLDCRELCKAIDTISTKLTDLALSIDFYALELSDTAAGDHVQWGIQGSLGSMSHYKSLKSLHVPFVMLLGWNCDMSANLHNLLPWNLSELCLSGEMTAWHNWDWDQDVMVLHIMSFLQQRSKVLKKIVMGDNIGVGLRSVKRNNPMFRKICEDAGIKYEWIKNQYEY